MARIKKHNAEEVEIIEVFLNKTQHPKAYAQKLSELMESGMTVQEAEHCILTIPFQMELYYSKFQGLFMVESEAVESIDIFNPYDKTKMIDCE